jgi:hypothetical protein
MRIAASLAVAVLLAGSALGAPVDDGRRPDAVGDEMRRARREARDAYERAREARAEAIEDAARRTVAGPGTAVPGWRDSPITPADEGSAAKSPPRLARRYGRLITFLVAGAVIALLLLRISLPWLFSLNLLCRRPKGKPGRPAERIPQTLVLRPLSERGLLRPSAPSPPARGVEELL